MKTIIFLAMLILAWGLEVRGTQSSECGTWRAMVIPESAKTPNHFLALFLNEFTLGELQRKDINPGLSDKNFKTGQTICLPIRTDAYWAKVRSEDAGLRGELKTAKGDIAKRDEEIKTLKSQLNWYGLTKGFEPWIIGGLIITCLVFFLCWRSCARDLGRFNRYASPRRNLWGLFESLLVMVFRRRT